MVIVWGTGYKLSLYNPQQSIAPAKVCTRGSDAAKSAVDHAADGRKLQQENMPLLIVFIPDTTPQGLTFRGNNDESAQDLSPLRATPNLHLRPPPAQPRSLG